MAGPIKGSTLSLSLDFCAAKLLSPVTTSPPFIFRECCLQNQCERPFLSVLCVRDV